MPVALHFRNRQLVAQAEIQGEFASHFEIVLRIPGKIGPLKSSVVGITEAAAAGYAKQERSKITSRIRQIRITRTGPAEADRAPSIVIGNAAVNAR